MRAFLSKTIHSRRTDTQCAYYMQQSKTTLPMMHAPIIPRQCQLTKYTYPTLSPAGQNSATKSRVDQSPTNTPPPHLARQHTRDTSSIRHNLTSPRAHNHQPPRNNTNHPGPASWTRSNPIHNHNHNHMPPALVTHQQNTKHFVHRKPQSVHQ